MSKEKFQAILKSTDPPERSGITPEKSLTNILHDAGGKLWDALAPAMNHGSAEISAVLFTGAGHVMYGHGIQPEHVSQPEHGLSIEVKQSKEEISPEREM